MNKSLGIVLIFCFAILFIAFLLWQYLFMIYEVTYKVTSKELFYDNEMVIEIKAIPLNSFGKKAPLRNAPCSFSIEEGAEFIKIVEQDEETGCLKIMAKGAPGKAVINVKSLYGLFPTKIVIPIYSNNT